MVQTLVYAEEVYGLLQEEEKKLDHRTTYTSLSWIQPPITESKRGKKGWKEGGSCCR